MKRHLKRKHPLFYAAMALVVAAPIAYYFWYTRDVDEVERAIVRIGFYPLRPPNNALTASMMIDLPAPVSPVNTLKLRFKRSCRRSIIAKSLIVNSISMIHFVRRKVIVS